ncbi:hypothetical protein COBT_002546 [Conglomerata obtusa]
MALKNIKLRNIIINNNPYITKGTNSTSLIIGGSELYTGAPYFAALASLRAGLDLTYIMANEEAIIPLKILLPEAVICKLGIVDFILNRASICIIGPGLGRPIPKVLELIYNIINKLIERNIYLIFDGDGIDLFIKAKNNLITYKKIIFTPNYNEMRKLVESVDTKQFIIAEKGANDVIHYYGLKYEVKAERCPKRCGGQGDILTGLLSYLVVNCKDFLLESIVFGCKIMRKSAYLAYQKKKASLIASDIIENINDAIDFMMNENLETI